MGKLMDVLLLRGLTKNSGSSQPVGLLSTPTVKKAGPLVGLAAIVGVTAAGILLEETPKEESGRTVKVEMFETGAAKVRHVSGRQYLKVYMDIAGIATACDGITGPEIIAARKAGKVFTEDECTALLEKHLIIHAKIVRACSPNVFARRQDFVIAATVSMQYNTGRYCTSTAKKQLEAGQTLQGCNSLLAWNKARVNGVLRPVQGLTSRRNRERQICLTGLPGYSPATMKQRMAQFR